MRPILRAIGVASVVVTCAYDREPTGVPDVRGTQAASQGGLVYAEERRAVELAREIPGLAGFYLDTAGNVVVAIKDRGETKPTQSLLRSKFQRELGRTRVRHPSADVFLQEATYSFLELKEWRDRLMNANILSVPGVVWLDLDEVQNHVVIGLDVGADAVGPRVVAQSLGVPAGAVEVEVTDPYVSQQTLRDEFRPVLGGIQIQRVSGTSRVACTLGFTAMRNNEQVFLTAGHCSPNVTATDNVAQFQPLAPLTHADSVTMSPIGRETLQFSEPCGSRRCSYSDAAVYGLIPSPAWGLGRIAQPVSGCFPGPCNPPVLNIGPSPYWVIDTTYQGFVVNDLVSKIGSATGWSQGSVSRTCVDVSPSSSVTYRCQMFATYGADDGDSGAPILLDIQGGADSTVTLGGIHSGRSGSNRVFSPWSGIVQDYGSLSVVPVQQDTARPPVPPLPNLPSDSTFTVEGAGYSRAELLFYRNIVGLVFDDSTKGTTIRSLLQRYGASIIGGVPGPAGPSEYIVQIPDPGPTFAAADSIVTRLDNEPGVARASMVRFRTPLRLKGRFPTDGPGAQRGDWVAPTNATRPLTHIRAPLAWGCQTGTYTSARVPVGVIDVTFDPQQPDLVGRVLLPPAPPSPLPRDPVLVNNQDFRVHGTAVAGVLTASGDNGVGVAGVLWGSDLSMYSYSRDEAYYQDLYRLFQLQLNDAINRGVRVITLSNAFGEVWNARAVAALRGTLQGYLDDGGMLVFAAGEDGLRLSIAQLAQTQNQALTAMDRAVAQLYAAGYADRIIFVAGTDDAGAFWAPSNFWTGATIVAPATNILALANTADGSTTILREGTSFSAPYVAGVAGLLWATDSTLTAAQVKDYIVRGGSQPRLNLQTGVFGPPPPVAGAPETVYQLDAYGALTLLASERSGVPLCGNRVWVSGTQLVAQRDPGAAPQVLADIGDTAAFVNVHHGGRRVDVWTDDFDPLSFVFNQGAWTVSGTPPASPDGGAWNSLWSLSHDGDTAVTVVNNQVTLDVRRGPAGGSSTHVADIPVPLASSGDFVCLYIDGLSGECQEQRFVGTSEFLSWWTAAYSPLGDRVIVSVSTSRIQTTSVGGMSGCPWETPGPNPSQCRTHIDYSTQTIGTTYHQIDLRTGNDSVLATPATAPVVVFWSALAEDGGQLVTGEGVMSQTSRVLPDTSFPGYHTLTTSQSTTACTLRYRQASSGLAPLFATASEDVCRGPLGGGSMAPAPPITSRTQ